MSFLLFVYRFGLRSLRACFQLFYTQNKKKISDVENDPDKASNMIYNLLNNEKPCMIARFGAFELNIVLNYLFIKSTSHSIIKYIKDEQPQWWWNEKLMKSMQNNAGFFPADVQHLSKFAELMINDSKDVDILGSWLKGENILLEHNKKVNKIRLAWLEPYFSSNPWSRVLEGKRVLVIHPFQDDIRYQYEVNRENLFSNLRVLPEFASLRIIKAVQSIGGNNSEFKDWFEALEWLENEMDKEPYDIALIGCGAYGFPLAAHAKRTGHKAVHLGGALQLLFGIKGKRWEYEGSPMQRFFNEYWCRPNEKYKPMRANQVEGACYW